MKNVFCNFLETYGLYDPIEITIDNKDELIELISGNVNIDLFCPDCKTNRVFHIDPIRYYYKWRDNDEDEEYYMGLLSDKLKKEFELTPLYLNFNEENFLEKWMETVDEYEEYLRVMHFSCVCAMDLTHRLDFVVEIFENKMMKIGQYPTYADLEISEIYNFKKILPDIDLKELRRANGLYSNGIGAGSYVYLRRVFERLVESAKDKAIQDGAHEDKFSGASIEQRIKELKNYLPEFLVNNKQIYGIISKGIHELSDEECLKYYPVMYGAIIMILTEWKEKNDREQQIRQLEKDINEIVSMENRKDE